MEFKRIVNNEIETKRLGEILGKYSTPGMVFTMTGDLGAGKTTMTKGIARGLGIDKTVTSPTFTICKIYQGRLPLYHFDAYRLEGSSEDLGFEEMIEGEGVSVVEWPDYMRDCLDVETMDISIRLLEDSEREITFTYHAQKYEEIAKELMK